MIRLGTVWGITLRVHILFPVLLIAAAMLGQGALVLPMVAALLPHEAAHALVSRMVGLRVVSLELMPFGGTARVEGAHVMRPWQEAVIALAGPLMNLLLIMAAALCVYVGGVSGMQVQGFIRCNLVLMGCNLLPVLPLDGGRVMRSALTPLFGWQRPTRLLAWMGYILAAVLLGLGIWGAVQGVVNITFFGAAAYLAYAAAQARHTLAAVYVHTLSDHAQSLRAEKLLPVRVLLVMADVSAAHVAEQLLPRYAHILLVTSGNAQEYRVVKEWALLDALMKDAGTTMGQIARENGEEESG